MGRIAKLLLIALLFLSAGNLSADNLWSYTLGFTGTELIVGGESPEIQYLQHSLGVDLRGSAVINPIGFYYGTILNVSFPVLLERYDYYLEAVDYYEPVHDLTVFVGLPFGFRSPVRGGRSSFYTGIGPAAMISADYDSHLWISGMLVTEIGLEFVREKGIGIGFSFRTYIGLDSIMVNLQESTLDDIEYVAAASPMVMSLVLGISWTSMRD